MLLNIEKRYKKISELHDKLDEILERLNLIELTLGMSKDIKSELTPGDWPFTISAKEAQVVANSTGLNEAAEKLGVAPRELKTQLESSGIHHFFGERWSISVQRALDGGSCEDTYKYPASLTPEKAPKVAEYLREGKTMRALAEKLSVSTNILGRFLQKHNYDTSGTSTLDDDTPPWDE